MSYEATERDGGVVVRATQTRSGDFRSRSPGAEFVITAPPGTSIDFDTSNGRVAVEGLEGSGRVHSSNGRITLEDVSGDFDVATSNGAVEASGFSGTLVASTSNGDISFSGALNAGSRNELRTSNGDITVRLPEGAGVAIDASTSRGQVRINRPIDASLTGDRFVIGVVGTGEADLVLRTSNGSVTIR